MTIKNKNESEIPKLKSYSFWDNGSEDENSVLKNLSLLPRRRAGDEAHYYLIDGVQRTIDKTLRVTKKKEVDLGMS
jgi:hypothetical protein